jgi:acyl-coenzyme A thioesterase PaaI-like protein
MASSINLISKLSFLSVKRRFSLFAPFFLMRASLEEYDDDWNKIRIRLPLTWMSRNAAGNMFGGFQASLADPIPAMACLKKFPDHRIATKKLEIDFVRVGNSDLILHFDFDPAQEQQIREELEKHGRATPCFDMVYIRADGKICSTIKNTVAIRPKGYISPIENKS